MVATLDNLFFAASLDALRGFIRLLPRRVLLFTDDALRRPRNDPLGAPGNGRSGDEDWGNLLHCEQHRWELSIGNYHSIRGNYHYPFLGVLFKVILHDFIRNNYHKYQSDRYPFFLIMVNYPTFLINYNILNCQIYY